MTSSSTLALVERTLPARYAVSLSGWRADFRERFLRPVARWIVTAGANAWVQQVNHAYQAVSTPRESAAASESLLGSVATRNWLLTMGRQVNRRTQTVTERWVPVHIAERLELLRRSVNGFNRWTISRPAAIPLPLAILLENADTRNFDRAFDDTRIAPSIRNGYYAHWKISLDLIALHQAHSGMLPAHVVAPVTTSLEISLRRALGLVLK